MKKILFIILNLLFVALFMDAQAQVSNLPATKSISSSNGEVKSKGIEDVTNISSSPLDVKASKSQIAITTNRGKNANAKVKSPSRQVVLGNFGTAENKVYLPLSNYKTSSSVCDTFANYTGLDSLTYYTFNYPSNKFGGYVSGTNYFKDKAKVEFFNINSPGSTLSTVYLLFGKAKYANATNSKVNIKVWDNTGTNGTPGTVLGTKSVKIKDIATDVTNGSFTTVTFSTPLTVNTAFYVGVELSSTAGDTVVLYTTTQYNQNSNTAFEEWSDNSWAAYDTSWGISLNHFIAAAVCVNSSVTAAFTANKTSVDVGETVTFTNQSTGSTSWAWTFTGAVPSTSTLENPNVVYYTPGTYTVSLTASDGFGTDVETKTGYITVKASTTCDTLHNFDFYNDTAVVYLNSGGGYLSGNNSWGDWGFADYFYGYPSGYQMSTVNMAFGIAEYSSSTSKIKVKVWDNTGTNGTPGNVLASKNVKISQIATDVANGNYTSVTFSSPITITTPFYVGFEVTYKSGDTVALYTNTVYNGNPNTAWTEEADSNWYAFDDATYNWGLSLNYLIVPVLCPASVGSAPVAAFKANATTIYTGNSVNFTDLSTNAPTSWAWAFTGGTPSTSTTQNPTGIVYNTAGTYTITLTATNAYGSDSETKTAYITVLDSVVPTDADFKVSANPIAVGSSVNFTDLSLGSPTSWSWSFTGGTPSTSTSQNPTNITYNAAGTYTVSLTASGPNGTDTETKTSYMIVLIAPTICDTLTNVDLAVDTPSYYSLGTGKGYVSGQNYYGDIAKADYYANYVAGSQLSEAMFWFGVAKYTSATTSKITVKVWDNTGANGEPGAVLASQDVTISSIAADIAQQQLTDVVFTSPATINTPYYLGIEFTYKTGDTVALVLNFDGETVPATAWEEWSDFTWWPYSDANSWGINVAHYMFPIVCYQGTITNVDAIKSDNRIAIYPNPTNGEFNLSTLFTQASNMKVTVVDMLGEVVYSTKYNNVMAGNYSIDLSVRSAGIYTVKIETDNDTFTKRIVIAK